MDLCDPNDPTYRSWIGDDTAPNIEYWPLQWATKEDLTCGIFTVTQAQALFERAFGATLTTQYRVRYEREIAWVARFSMPARAGVHYFDLPPGTSLVPVELCFNAACHWRVSQQYGFVSVPFLHDDDPALLLQRLAEALERVV